MLSLAKGSWTLKSQAMSGLVSEPLEGVLQTLLSVEYQAEINSTCGVGNRAVRWALWYQFPIQEGRVGSVPYHLEEFYPEDVLYYMSEAHAIDEAAQHLGMTAKPDYV